MVKSIDVHDWNTTFKPFQAFLLGQVTHVISDFPTIHRGGKTGRQGRGQGGQGAEPQLRKPLLKKLEVKKQYSLNSKDTHWI